MPVQDQEAYYRSILSDITRNEQNLPLDDQGNRLPSAFAMKIARNAEKIARIETWHASGKFKEAVMHSPCSKRVALDRNDGSQETVVSSHLIRHI